MKTISWNEIIQELNNTSVTENGAVGYRTVMNALLDLNFKVSSLRNRSEEYIVAEFIKAYYESPKYAVKWLFFVRDILEGLGERRTFRVCLKYLAVSHPKVARAVIGLIPEYGRYDDALVLLDTDLAEDVAYLYKAQLEGDLLAMQKNEPISLLAKWLPSVNTSSETTRKYAEKLCKLFGMSKREYRQTLSKLRAYGNVVEVKMTAGEWASIDYATVPAKANLNYDSAFAKHDYERRADYLMQVLFGDGKMNAKGIMPYEIVHRYAKGEHWHGALKEDLLNELMWKKILEDGFTNEWGFEDAIVVADGSGSMFLTISDASSVTSIEVCDALAIYFAEKLKGAFHNKAITFSENPQFIEFPEESCLKDKLEIMYAHNEIANTNIEAVFDLLLALAQSCSVPKEELPKQVLIISDMEFDDAVSAKERKDEKLFTTIARKYEKAGYKMPRLIFWNVCGRTDTIPMVDNEEGLCLLSGFSQNAMKIAADRSITDPYDALISILDSPRYQAVEEAMKM